MYCLQNKVLSHSRLFVSASQKISCRFSCVIGNDVFVKWRSHSRYYCSAAHIMPPEGKSEHSVMKEKTIAVTEGQRKKLAKKKPVQPPNPHILKIAIIGAPNAGKSTLANRLIGHRVAPVSSKVHTTRHTVAGIRTEVNKQLIFLDTPGIITPAQRKNHRLERTLLLDPHTGLFEADLIAVVADISTPWGREKLDREVLRALHMHCDKKSILILNKVDTLKKKDSLFKTTRQLTEGLVDGKKESIKASEIFRKKYYRELRHLNKVSGGNVRETQERIAKEKPWTSTSEDISLSAGKEALDNLFDKVCQKNNKESGSGEREVSSDPGVCDSASAESKAQDGSDSDGTKLPTKTVGKYRDKKPDLWDGQEWHEYHSKLRELHHQLLNKKGWPHFSAVYMVSAKGGDGTENVLDYLLENTYPGEWMYNDEMVTNQNPLELAKMCIWEKMLDHLPDDIPYIIKVVPEVWEINENGVLCAAFDLRCKYEREMTSLLGPEGSTIRKISMEAKQELMNSFRRDIILKLTATQNKL